MTQSKEKNWWNRNWKWLVPASIGAITLIIASVFAFIWVILSFMKSSDSYKEAVAKVEINSAVIEALGSPIEEGFFIFGNINISGSSGEANLAIPISGPNGSATIYAIATKSGGKWTFSILVVEIKGSGERINLLE